MQNVLERSVAPIDTAAPQNLGTVQPPVKDAHTRLLDMLAGWSEFVQREEGDGGAERVGDAPFVVDDICRLYQEVGAIDDMDASQVRAFVGERIVPLLLAS